jgi:tryptophanyl-tRNA synthetase
MAIDTDSTPLEEPKNPDTCNVFALYKLVASESQTAALREKYEAGGFGYGHAKQALYELLLERFEEPRKKYEYYINNPQEIDKALEVGAEKARSVANAVLERVRKKIGY